MRIVYFSSATGNTRRFVEKIPYSHDAIPVLRTEDPLKVHEPFVLCVPTYGGGVSITGEKSRPVPPQVIRFLNNPENRHYLRGVIAGGNRNFGKDYCLAGDVISKKCQVPYLYRFELMGNERDVELVTQGLHDFEQSLVDQGQWESPPDIANATNTLHSTVTT